MLRPGWRYAVLAPLMLCQAAIVSRRTLRLPPAAGRAGCCGEPEGAILLVGIGDSTIAGIGVDSHRDSLLGRTAARLHECSGRAVAWQVHGFSGLTLRGALERLLPAVPVADAYLISAGVNDVIDGTPATAFVRDLSAMVAALRARSPHCGIVYAGIPLFSSFPALPWPLSACLDSRGQALQSAARSVARELHIACHDFPGPIDPRDFAGDGFHPGPAGCDRWAGALARLLQSAGQRA